MKSLKICLILLAVLITSMLVIDCDNGSDETVSIEHIEIKQSDETVFENYKLTSSEIVVEIIGNVKQSQNKKEKDGSMRKEKIKKKLEALNLVNIQELSPHIKVDIKYASEDNFTGQNLYGEFDCCYLREEVAWKLINAQNELIKKHPNYTLLVYDCLRPRSVQKRMWEMLEGTDSQKYVANPEKGSIHNYGSAVDLTIFNLDTNEVLDMGTKFDHLGKLAQPRLEEQFLKEGKLNKTQIQNRHLLRNIMQKAGFLPISIEWWHFNGYYIQTVKKKYSIIEEF